MEANEEASASKLQTNNSNDSAPSLMSTPTSSRMPTVSTVESPTEYPSMPALAGAGKQASNTSGVPSTNPNNNNSANTNNKNSNKTAMAAPNPTTTAAAASGVPASNPNNNNSNETATNRPNPTTTMAATGVPAASADNSTAITAYHQFYIMPKQGQPAELTCTVAEFLQVVLRLPSTSLSSVMTRDTASRIVRALKDIENRMPLDQAIDRALDGADKTMMSSLQNYITAGTFVKDVSVPSKLRKNLHNPEETNPIVVELEEYPLHACRIQHQSMHSRSRKDYNRHRNNPASLTLSTLGRKFGINAEGEALHCNSQILKYLLPSQWPDNAATTTTETAVVPTVSSRPAGTGALVAPPNHAAQQLMSSALSSALSSSGGGSGPTLSGNTFVGSQHQQYTGPVYNGPVYYCSGPPPAAGAPPPQPAPAPAAAPANGLTIQAMEEAMGRALDQSAARSAANTERLLEPLIQTSANTQQMVHTLSTRKKPRRRSSFSDPPSPSIAQNLADRFEAGSPDREQPPYVLDEGFLKQQLVEFCKDKAEEWKAHGFSKPMDCREEILGEEEFVYPPAFVFLKDSLQKHGGQLLLENFLSVPTELDDDRRIETSIMTTKLCVAAIMIEMDERYGDRWDDLQIKAEANANPLMPALCLTNEYAVAITLQDDSWDKKKTVMMTVCFMDDLAAGMMAALLRALSCVPNATMVKIESPNGEFASGLSCNGLAWNDFLMEYPPDNSTTLHFKLFDFPEHQLTPLAFSHVRLLFEECSFKNFGTCFAQADELYRQLRGHDKEVKIRVCFLRAINFGGGTVNLLGNLHCAIGYGTMAFLCFNDINLEHQELGALRDVCQAALKKEWEIVLDEGRGEDVNFDQEKKLVLRELRSGPKLNRAVYQYCTAEETPAIVPPQPHHPPPAVLDQVKSKRATEEQVQAFVFGTQIQDKSESESNSNIDTEPPLVSESATKKASKTESVGATSKVEVEGDAKTNGPGMVQPSKPPPTTLSTSDSNDTSKKEESKLSPTILSTTEDDATSKPNVESNSEAESREKKQASNTPPTTSSTSDDDANSKKEGGGKPPALPKTSRDSSGGGMDDEKDLADPDVAPPAGFQAPAANNLANAEDEANAQAGVIGVGSKVEKVGQDGVLRHYRVTGKRVFKKKAWMLVELDANGNDKPSKGQWSVDDKLTWIG